MYLEYRDKIATDHRESFTRSYIVCENILCLSMWFLAGWLVWPLQWYGFPIAVIVWGTVVVLVQVLLKKHNCSGCYYYGKACHLGWGMVSARLFAKDSGSIETGKRLSLFYILSPPTILLTAILEGILLEVKTLHWVLLGLYILLNVISFPVRMKGCKVCAIRNACPGSACKTGCG